MLLEFIVLNSPHVVAVNCDNQNVIGKKMVHRKNWKIKKLVINKEFTKNTMAKCKSDLKSIELEHKLLLKIKRWNLGGNNNNENWCL